MRKNDLSKHAGCQRMLTPQESMAADAYTRTHMNANTRMHTNANTHTHTHALP